MESLCELIKEAHKQEFNCLYWALKCWGSVCMDFKDLDEAIKVFTRLKHECQDKMMYRHKMVTYKQLGYVYRLQKEHLKATNCFKKFLQLSWFNEDIGAEIEAYESLSIDYFYMGKLDKATYYDQKYKYGEFED